MSQLSVTDLTVKLGTLTLANNLSFTLNPGETVVILGPNGTGKSTLLKTLFGEIKPQGGDIRYGNEPMLAKQLSRWRTRFGYMPQDIHLDVGLTAMEVVLLGRMDALSLRVDDSLMHQAITILTEMGLTHLANRDVRTLSGGQCQMILFAQALMRQPEIIMLDEPVSALDLHFQHVLLGHLRKQTKARECITVMVLHDLNLAAQYADRLLVLKNGTLITSGAPAQVLTSELVESVYQVQAQVVLDEQGIPFVRTCGH